MKIFVLIKWKKVILVNKERLLFFFNYYLLHVRLNSHYKAPKLQEKEEEDERDMRKLFKKNAKVKGVY